MMDEMLIARRDSETTVILYERWSREMVEQYVLDENGEKVILWSGPNLYGMVPFLKIRLPL